MQNKVVYIGDPHFKHNNNDYVDEFIKVSLRVVADNRPCICVVAGDVLDTHEKLHQTPLNKAVWFLKRLASLCPTFVLVGNHDYINNQQFLSDNHWMNCLKDGISDLFVVDRPVRSRDALGGGTDLVFVPYVPPGRFVEALDTLEGDWRTCDCIFAHQEFRGGNLGVMTSEHGDAWPLDYPFVVSGHIHKRHSPQENILYPGSVIQHNFGEERNEGGVAVFEFAGGKMTTEYVSVDIPHMYSVTLAFDELLPFLEKHVPRPLQRVRILCHVKPGEKKTFTKAMMKKVPTNVNLVFRETRGHEAAAPVAAGVASFDDILTENITREACDAAFAALSVCNSFEEFVARLF